MNEVSLIKIYFPQEYGKEQIEIATCYQCGCCMHNISSAYCKKYDGFKPNKYETGQEICAKFEQEIPLDIEIGLSSEVAERQRKNIEEYLRFVCSQGYCSN